jgi:DNA-binding NtrC family response regulator
MASPVDPITLVAIDDDPAMLELIEDVLGQPGLDIIKTTDAERGLELVQQKHAAIVICDVTMPKLDGMTVLQRIVEDDVTVDVFLLTGQYSTDAAVQAIKLGAADYLTKPTDPDKLRDRIEQALQEIRKRRRVFRLDEEMLNSTQFAGMIGRSARMAEVFGLVRRVAPHFRCVLVTGETGTGKEVAARALHELSPAARGPFVVCNCAAFVESLLESQLFGYVKGAFTGAQQDTMGLIEAAHCGTLFLDEIGELSLPGQAKLLRVLQNFEVQRVGATSTRKVDVRVIAATNRDLRAMISEKTFREDLYFRISMVQVDLPRLAERGEDLILLERYMLDKFSKQYSKTIKGISSRAQGVLSRYDWPGNVRELENVLGHACMMADGEVVDVQDLPSSIRQSARPRQDSFGLVSFDELQQRHLKYVLESVGGNKQLAAEILGISRSTLYTMLNDAGTSNNNHGTSPATKQKFD